MLKRALTLLVVNTAVFCLLAEVLGLAVFYYQHGWLFYSYPYLESPDAPSPAAGEALTAIGVHPYFGPVHRPGIPFDVPPSMQRPGAPRVATNNFGFVSPHAYPFTRARGDQFLVGIFGGSVGAWFCQVGATRLIEVLRRDPAFASREIVPLCFSHEGYKQPQQLIMLAYFLSIGQAFDLVVNIDGFNEVTLGRLNEERGWDASMPSAMHLGPLIDLVNQSTLTAGKLEALAEVTRRRQQALKLRARIAGNRLASVHLALEQYAEFVDRKYREALVAFEQQPSAAAQDVVVHVTPRLGTQDEGAALREIADEWARSSMLMQALLAQRGAAYVHVVQPNQYFTTRTFSPEEASVARSNASPFRAGVEKGYPRLVEVIESQVLQKAGVHVFNGLSVFDAEPAPVYMDDCCHYTRVGNERLAEFIGTSILRTPALRPRIR